MIDPVRRTTRVGPDLIIEEFDSEEGQWICIDVRHAPCCHHCGDDDHHSYECTNSDLNWTPEESELSIEDSPQYGDC